MKILITGGAGFIGSHLAERLLSQKQEVVIIDDFSTGRYENIAHLVDHHRVKLIVDTIMNHAMMERLIQECNVVFHLAASVGVKRIVNQPVNTIETNVLGSHTVLNLAAKYNRKVILFSTSEVYGKNEGVPYKESDDCVFGSTQKSRWSYGCTKALDEFLGLAYHKEQGLPIIIVRIFNMIGIRQTGRYGMVVPTFIRQALNELPLTVYGDGTQSRCFTFVSDMIEGLLELYQHPGAIGEIFNIGSMEEITIEALAKKIISKTASKSEIVHIPYKEAYEEGFEDMIKRRPDISKIQKLTGFQLKTDLDSALDTIIAYERGQKP